MMDINNICNRFKTNENLISMILCLYKEPEEWIFRSIDSLLNQTYRNIEIIIEIDDPQFDRSLIEKIEKRNIKNNFETMISGEEYVFDNSVPIIVTHIHDVNMGAAESRNKGIQSARGKYIGFLDGDDISDINRLRIEVDVLQAGNYDLVSSSFIGINKDEQELWKSRHINNIDVRRKLLRGNYICTSTVLARAEILKENSGFRNLKIGEDYDLWLRLLSKGYIFGHVNEYLVKYRVNLDSVSHRGHNTGRYYTEYVKLLYRERHRNRSMEDSFDANYIREFVNYKDFEQKYMNFDSRIRFIKKLIRGWNQPEFIKKINEMDANDELMPVHHYGNKNIGVRVFLIDIDNTFVGLGGLLRWVQYGIIEAERLGFVPVIRLNSPNRYSEPEPLDGTSNMFEYYFKQMSGISYDLAKESSDVFGFDLGCVVRVEQLLGNLNSDLPGGYLLNDHYYESLAGVTKRWLQFNSKTQKLFQESLDKYFPFDFMKKKSLGIHIRGTDFNQSMKNHPKMVAAEQYLLEVEKLISSEKFDYIFLATDDLNCLNVIRNKFEEKRYLGDEGKIPTLLYFEDTHRETSIKNNAPAISIDRKNDHYLNGFEVLRDIYTLSICTSLIGGLSHVTSQARIFKLSRGDQYNDVVIVSNGIA